MNIHYDYIPVGAPNRPGVLRTPEFITIHETGNTDKTATAAAHAKYLKSASAAADKVSWHFTADEREIYQHLPVEESAFHAGDGRTGPGNLRSIGIEICVNGNFEKAADNAAELTCALCARYGIPLCNVVQHNRWNGKDCPQKIRSGALGGWDAFISRVEKALDAKKAGTPSPWAARAVEKAVNKGVLLGTDTGDLQLKENVTTERLMVFFDRCGLFSQ